MNSCPSPFFIVAVIIIFGSPCASMSDEALKNFTLYGAAQVTKGSITLTHSTSGVGRAMLKEAFRFLDPVTSKSASFSSHFSFVGTDGDGIAFLIASNPASVSNNLWLPTDSSFFAVEFDTHLDVDLGDLNDNHIGLDVNSLFSSVAVDAASVGIKLKDGKLIFAWIEYTSKLGLVNVWVSHSKSKPIEPIISYPLDFSVVFLEFMFVGVSASNRGITNSKHLVKTWSFRVYSGDVHVPPPPRKAGNGGDVLVPPPPRDAGNGGDVHVPPPPPPRTTPDVPPPPDNAIAVSTGTFAEDWRAFLRNVLHITYSWLQEVFDGFLGLLLLIMLGLMPVLYKRFKRWKRNKTGEGSSSNRRRRRLTYQQQHM